MILFAASENTPLASDLDEADNASGTTSSSKAKSEKTENLNIPSYIRVLSLFTFGFGAGGCTACFVSLVEVRGQWSTLGNLF